MDGGQSDGRLCLCHHPVPARGRPDLRVETTITYYCPNRWAEVPEGSERCAVCGHSLAPGDEDYVDKLIAALRHPEPTRAALAVQILGDMLAERRAIPPLIDLLDTARDAYVLRSAIEALGRFGDPSAVPALSRAALDQARPLVVRRAAVEALAAIGGEEGEAALRGALSDPSQSVRDLAAGALDLEGPEH